MDSKKRVVIILNHIVVWWVTLKIVFVYIDHNFCLQEIFSCINKFENQMRNFEINVYVDVDIDYYEKNEMLNNTLPGIEASLGRYAAMGIYYA